MKIFDFPQKSPEWWAIRRGIPTASAFDRILTPAKGLPSSQQDSYMDELLAQLLDEQWSREPDDTYISGPMQDGIDCEPMARCWYEFEHDLTVQQVGFCMSDCGRYGGSPDSLIGDDGILEIKCPTLKTHIGYLRVGGLPTEYKCQCHGLLAITGRKWLDFVSYSPVDQLESLVVRVQPNEFTEKLQNELVSFCARLEEAKARLHVRNPK